MYANPALVSPLYHYYSYHTSTITSLVLMVVFIQCDRTTALKSLHTELLQPPTKIGVIGSGCSVATEPTAEVSHYYNLTHVSDALLIVIIV